MMPFTLARNASSGANWTREKSERGGKTELGELERGERKKARGVRAGRGKRRDTRDAVAVMGMGDEKRGS